MEIQIQKIDNVIFSFSRDDEGDDITPLVTSSEKLRKIINKAGYKNDFTAEEKNLWNGIFNVVNEKFSVNK